jgi:hypothetical protein
MTAGINVTVSSTAAGVNVSGGTAATIAVSTGVGTAGTSVAITVSGGIGPAGFITAPGSATNAFGVFQLTAGDGITISTSAAQFQIASYGTASLGSYAPVQSVAGRTGTVTLVAGDITAGTLAVARIPTISYTALSNVPTTFTPATHTHSQAEVLPAQAGYVGPLVTDGTTAAWTSRYSIVSPVIVQGSGMAISRDTAAGTISIAYAGGTSGVASVNGITGTPTIVAGANVTVTTAASSITIAAASGGGGTGSFSWASVPSSSTATGSAGSLSYDTDYLYLATATDTWKRTALSPFGGDLYLSSVSLLLHLNGNNGSTTITDSSTSPKTCTAYGNAAISTTQSKFGGASAVFDGTGDYILSSSNAAWSFGTGDFTVECWVYRTSAPSQASIMGVGYTVGGFGFFIDNSHQINVTRPGTAIDHTFNASVPTNAWSHIAITRSGTSLRCYVDGVQKGSTATNSTNYAQGGLTIGIDGDTSTQPFDGYIDEFRITKGVARYTGSTYTVPTTAFPDF